VKPAARPKPEPKTGAEDGDGIVKVRGRCAEVRGGARGGCAEGARRCAEVRGGARRCAEGARRCAEVRGGARRCAGGPPGCVSFFNFFHKFK
jgi:hypothetical protein